MHTDTAVDPRDLIEELRIKRGFPSLRALALHAGVSQPTLTRYMNGKTATMEAHSFMALAHSLGITVSELLGEVPVGSSVAAREVQRLLATMSPDQQQQLLRLGKALKGD